ncbi:hypothetical protein QYE76_044661 [Lolium multiflorum]|uniref:Uncharacterized protein n=1 Tax=Lolium multiflorum TaxID=4521 RepID=A0AAD8TLI1_LOLMU|nr:hypothetical protein QYE76_044661 [Lolium multiflorum]
MLLRFGAAGATKFIGQAWRLDSLDRHQAKRLFKPVDFRTVEHTSPFNEPDDPINSETAHANFPHQPVIPATEGSVRNDDADHNAFVDAAVEETRASPMKRSIGGFADEDDLLDFDDTFIEPPLKKARSDAVSPAAAASEASALKAAPVMQASTASSLSKGKDAPAAAAAPPSDLRGVISSLEAFASQFTSLEADKIRLQEEAKSSSSKLEGAIKKAAVARQEVDSLKEELNKLKERLKEEEARAAEKDELLNLPWPCLVFPVPSFVDDSSGVVPENDRIQRMKDRITQMEKDLRSTYALAAIINKKSETAADVERYALTELHKATESLNFIALNGAEENKRIHERVNALVELSSAEEIFWREHSKASAVARFQDRVQQVHHFFDKCYRAMRVIWKTMFPLNAVPPRFLR